MSFHLPEIGRIEHPFLGFGNDENGLFVLKDTLFGVSLLCLASNGCGWEHVSVSTKTKNKRLPNWEEMCFVKSLFWDSEDCVVQFHPPKSEYIDMAPVLHLWRKTGFDFPRPPKEFVGYSNE